MKELLQVHRVSMVFIDSLKDVTRKFQVYCFKKVSGVSFGRFPDVSRVFRKKVQSVFHGCF